MKNNRKVRKDFDREKEYSVNVSGCTEEEKMEVQQAFFDVGLPWEFHGESYEYTDAVAYTNVLPAGWVFPYLMCGSSTTRCNMTAKEFLDLVYEPIETKKHIHAGLMAQCDDHNKWIPNTGEIVLFKRTDSIDYAYDSPEKLGVVAVVGSKVWLKNALRDVITSLDNITQLKKEKTLQEKLVEIMSPNQLNYIDVYQAANRLIEAGVKVVKSDDTRTEN